MNHKKIYPSTTQQVKNLSKSIYDYAKSGFKNVTTEQYKDRLNICNKCEFLDDSRCTQCGCFIGVKAWIASEKCPIDKWLPIIKKENGEEENN